MSLTDTKVKNARPSEKAVKLADGFSLYRFKILAVRLSLQWQTEGVFYWVYPAVSLADARQRRDEAKRLLAQGIDPNAKTG
ncbi:phage integrase [Salmonella enterica subsp. enterica]|nr:phage integrase [Salmonella enterica subsp. enterica]